MEDRNVQFPNRYRLTKVPGTDDIYEVIPAPGEISKEGSLVNKSLLFSDIAAGMFNLYEPDATPNKAFEFLGKFNQHWWKRKSLNEQYGISISDEIHVSYREGYQEHFITVMEKGDDSYSLSVQYSDGVELSGNKVVLKQPISTKKVSINNIETSAAFLRGKYFKPAAYEGYSDYPYEDRVTYVMPDASFSSTQGSGGGAYYIFASNVKEVSSELVESGAIDYVQSNDRSAYPDSGEQDGYEYEYLGVPFENLPGAPKIETGLYTGNGRYGKSNPNSLTFGFEPNILIVTGVGGSATKYQDIGFFIRNAERSFGTGAGQLSIYYNGGLDKSANVVTWNGKTVSWYSPSASNQASIQLNNRSIYNYVAFG